MRYLSYDEEMRETEADHRQEVIEKNSERNIEILHDLDETNFDDWREDAWNTH